MASNIYGYGWTDQSSAHENFGWWDEGALGARRGREIASRVAAGIAGGALIAYAVRKRGPLGTTLGVLGAGMIASGIVPRGRARARHAGIEVCKELLIMAPVERVFDFWTNYENFPRFMSHVREVRDTGFGRSLWVVSGPAGVPIEWDAVVTEMSPNRLLAWTSVPGSQIDHFGEVRFQGAPGGPTRVDVRMSYRPPAGRAGHALARLFGSDPKSRMDADLANVKSLIEGEVLASTATGRWSPGH
jgi:uncharacterized membrane protein